MVKKWKNKWLEVIFIPKSATFLKFRIDMSPGRKFWPFCNVFQKSVESLNLVYIVIKWKNKWLEKIFMQKSAFFFTIYFWSYSVFKNFDLFAKKCVKPQIDLNGKKIEKEMARCDFYANICNFLYYRFLIQAVLMICKKVRKAWNWSEW